MTEHLMTTTTLSNLDIHPVITSHSIDGVFEFCPRKFEFMYVWQQAPQGGLSGFAAEVGTAMHEAVQAWARLALFPGRAWKAENQLAYTHGLKTLLRWWPWALEEVSLAAGKQGIKQRSLGEAILLYEQIIGAEFWESWELIHIGDFGLSIEIPWRINHASLGTFPLPTGGLGYIARQGKIDFVLRHRQSGEIRVIDLKTTVKDEAAHAAAFKFSGQGPDYALIIAHALGFDWRERGLKMSYFVSNFASADGSEDASNNVYTYTYSPEDIQDGIDTKFERMFQMKSYGERGWWKRRSHGCDSFGQPCAYFNICHRRDSNFIKLWFADNDYEESTRIYKPIWELIA